MPRTPASSFRRIGGASEFIVPVFTKIKLPPRVPARNTPVDPCVGIYLDSRFEDEVYGTLEETENILDSGQLEKTVVKHVCRRHVASGLHSGYNSAIRGQLSRYLLVYSWTKAPNSQLFRELSPAIAATFTCRARHSTLTFRAVTWKESFAKILRAIVKANLILGLCRREVNSRRWELAKRF